MNTDTYNLCNLVLQALVWLAMIATFLVYRGQLLAMREAATGQNVLSLVNFLQTKEVREARRIVRENLRQKNYSDWSAEEKLAASMVCSNYDVAAVLIFQQKMVPSLPFLKNWGPSIIDCYRILEPHIVELQKPHNSGPAYWDDFLTLYQSACAMHHTAQPGSREGLRKSAQPLTSTLATMFQFTDSERSKNIAAAIQSWIVSIAIVVGGVWTLVAFTLQLQGESAKAHLEKLEIEAVPKLELNLDVTSLPALSSPGRRYVEGRFSVKNFGMRSTTLQFGEKPISIFHVVFDKDGQPTLQRIRSIKMPYDQNSSVGSMVVQVNATNWTSFVTYVEQPGLYYLKIEAPRQKSEVTEALKAGAKFFGPEGRSVWSAERYVVVK